MRRKSYLIVILGLCFLFLTEMGISQDQHSYNKKKRPTQSNEKAIQDSQKPENASKKAIKTKAKAKKSKPFFTTGIKGGMVFSYLSSDTFSSERGLDGSIYLANEINLFEHFYLEVDIGYHSSTYSSKPNFYEVNYFSIPIIIKYYFSRHFLDPKILEFNAGFGMDFRFKVNESGFGSSISSADKDQGFLFVLGTRWPIYEDLVFTVDFRFYLGLGSAVNSTSNEKSYFREMELLFGVSYNIF